jgi:hypothetical protein
MYYKSREPAVLAAIAACDEQRLQLIKEMDAIKEAFGAASYVVSTSLNDIRFSALRFSPAMDARIWTKPSRENGTQWPRTKPVFPTGTSKEDKAHAIAQHAELVQKYKALDPTTKADYSPFWKALGTNWGNLLFCGMSFFRHPDGTCYFSTGAALPNATEILGSEYSKAKAEADAAERLKKAA